uniref:Uncharacterized protein n=1 Tax=Sus scrofa TaxID=9823 RepID=A0A4X1UCL6_PIG
QNNFNKPDFKNKIGSWARWRAPVVPATREAEAEGSLEPRSSGLQCAIVIAPVNSRCTPACAT